jgi:hypothetical protein
LEIAAKIRLSTAFRLISSGNKPRRTLACRMGDLQVCQQP